MSDPRSRILAAIRTSLAEARLPAAPRMELAPVDPSLSTEALVEQFAAELRALTGTFIAARAAEVPDVLEELVRTRSSGSVLAWRADQLPLAGALDGVRRAGVTIVEVDVPRDAAREEALKAYEPVAVGITGVDAALADTGTLALLSGPGRPRLAAMSVRTHIALFTRQQLYPSLAAWMAPRNAGGLARPDLADHLRARSALLLVTGPSRTADIEMTLTVGVHGPGEVIAVVIE